MARITIRVQPGASTRVQPGASTSEVSGYGADGVLKVRATAPPAEGAANQAVIKVLSKMLGVPRSSITILRGDTGRQKVVNVAGMDEAELRTRVLLVPPRARKEPASRSSG